MSTIHTERRLSVAKDAVSGLGDKAYESFREVFEDITQKHEDEVCILIIVNNNRINITLKLTPMARHNGQRDRKRSFV